MAFSKFVTFLTVGVYAFVSWAVVLFVLSLVQMSPRPVFVLVHYLLNVAVFGVVFHVYYQQHPTALPFQTTVLAFLSLVLLEWIFWMFVSTGFVSYFNFVDWIFPAFLLVSTIYFVGKKGI